jgi:hypothetical protein
VPPTPGDVRISQRASAARADLDPVQTRKLEWWFDRLRSDAFAGDQIPKGRIPGGLAARHGLPRPLRNLWRFELPGGLRGLYTIGVGPGRGAIVLVLEILTHREYDRLLGYR